MPGHDGGVMADNEPLVVGRWSGVVAIAKPSGLPTQAPPGIASVESWVRANIPLARGGYLGVPHRLDRAVSGILLLAETPRAARHLSRQFERRQIAKRYLAVLATDGGTLPVAGATWEDHLLKVPDEPRARLAAPGEAGARQATTRVGAVQRVVAPVGEPVGPGQVVVMLEPSTGRMHQLRVQCASRGHPVVGDELYGGPAFDGAAGGGDRGRQPILLHAWDIAWRDPDTAAPRSARAEPPAIWPLPVAAALARVMTPAASPRE
jgi:23S rRNA pseudouridine1911/1915/1917 synthase